jgi:hypothetical protein
MKMAIDKLRESEIGRKIIDVVGEEGLYNYEPNSLNSLHITAVINHSREQKEKLKIQYKKVDYLIRAQHEAEVPLLQKQTEEEVQRRREIQRAERERAIERRERLMRMEDDKNDFLRSIHGQRHEDYMKRMKEFDQRLKIARQQRLEQLRIENIERRKQEIREQKKLKQKRKEEEKQRKIREEIKRKEDERLALLRAADFERNKRLAEQVKKQREREEEIEKKLQAERNAVHPTSTPSGGIRRAGATGGGQPQDKTDRFVYLEFKFQYLMVYLFCHDSRPWRLNPREGAENQPSQSNSTDSWRTRNEDQR